jgi:hypothetical protein
MIGSPCWREALAKRPKHHVSIDKDYLPARNRPPKTYIPLFRAQTITVRTLSFLAAAGDT